MPIYVRKCVSDVCDHWFEETKPMAQSDDVSPCPKCGGPAEKAYLPSYVSASNAEPIIVYKDRESGEYRYPGDPKGLSAANYERLGFDRIELRGWADVRRFERDVNTRQGSEIARRMERRLEAHEAEVKARRSDVINGLRNGFQIPEIDEQGRRTGRMKTVRMSAAGADILRACMERSDAKPRHRTYDSNFHSEVYSFDRGNREESRGADGRRRRD